jgi:WhiB family redox-sensing transcriptional regulator
MVRLLTRWPTSTSFRLTRVRLVKTSRENRNPPVTKQAVAEPRHWVSGVCPRGGPAPATGHVVDIEEYTTMDWRHRALCRDEDPELFFPIGTTGPGLVQVEQAKAVCRRCPVVEPCLDWALRSGQDSGIWGGLAEDERRALKRRQTHTRVHSA